MPRNIVFRPRNIVFRTRNIVFRTRNIVFWTRNIVFRTRNIVFRPRNSRVLPRGVIFRPRDIVFRPRRQVNELLSGLDRYDGDGEICVGLASEWMIRNDPGFVYNPDDMLFQVPFAPPFPP